mmetsp:Transcript_51950/g.121808  ORF Transcript_51950/g.121808 Transcript_51950/m.121808 type:complete len:265 (+) Transcript_51950:72-866(+)
MPIPTAWHARPGGKLPPSKDMVLRVPVHWTPEHKAVEVSMVIEEPEKLDEKRRKGCVLSELASLLKEQRFPEPRYFRNVDCMGIPGLLSLLECIRIINVVEPLGFQKQFRLHVQDMQYVDIVDPEFAQAIWDAGLGWVLRTVSVDGLVPYGLNDVIRIQKYEQGGYLSRHIDRSITPNGLISKYSLRVFLNNSGPEGFDGGLSVFHVPHEAPVIFEPTAGLGLLYPQGELCTLQEESEVIRGAKYVLRADVLFGTPEGQPCKKN